MGDGGNRAVTGNGALARAGRALALAAAAWATVAVLGQLLMAVYVFGFYGGHALRGDFEAWNKVLPHGLIAGDPVGNAVLASHLLFAGVIFAGGGLQLLPALRRRAPRLHRWNGRLYVFAAVVMALGGAWMNLSRGGIGGDVQQVGILLNAALILAFAAMAVMHARGRRFDAHRRWALRLFLAVGGVWFLRLMVFAWIAANGGPVGFDPATFTGPALVVIAFLSYGLPLAVLQVYLRAQASAAPAARWAMAAALAAFTALTVFGIVVEAMALALPRLMR